MSMIERPLRVAIIGSGAPRLRAPGKPVVEVDMLERLPTPWGLVRSGVAPDHPKIKSVTRVYEKTAEHPRFRFFGGVELGTHIGRAELLGRYHVVLYAVGTSSDNR